MIQWLEFELGREGIVVLTMEMVNFRVCVMD